MKVAVVGAGIMGSSAARFLAKRGHDVTLIEQFELGHDKGSSHGRSRIVRKAYPDAFYSEIMLEGYPMWSDLERESGRKLLYECGLMYFGPETTENIRSMIAGLSSLGVDHQVMNPAEARTVFPTLHLDSGEVGVFTPEAGWVRADEAIRATIDLANAHGAKVVQKRIESTVEVENEFDAVVWCAGGWISKFFELPVDIQARTFAYLEGFQPGPVWIEEGPGLHYGFPSEPDSNSLKIGGHVYDQPFAPDRPDRPVVEPNVEAIRDLACRRFGIAEPMVTESKMCIYTWHDNEDFLIGRATEKSYFASPCSGHGFKFGPWVGHYLADLVEGRISPSKYPRFNANPKVLA